ncbi:hypothetical protein ES319_A08G106600v1 [Gossypium barbadense]|uniref:Pectinesterase inhibitor domain-containing protein n=2 Tax=Gossypium TaxID=3633 RepID=A0A5J5UPV2_GOSBA|nr:hypothetical protein ES319_A08G106600v1 [Gossypium barbadense]
MAKISPQFSKSAINILVLPTIHPILCLPANFFLRSQINMEFIKTWCDATTYLVLCFATFTSYAAEIHGSPKILATKSIFVTLNTTLSAFKTLTELPKRQVKAHRDCGSQRLRRE